MRKVKEEMKEKKLRMSNRVGQHELLAGLQRGEFLYLSPVIPMSSGQRPLKHELQVSTASSMY